MSPHRQHYTPPPRRHPRIAKVADVLVATALAVLLALSAVHWASCEGLC